MIFEGLSSLIIPQVYERPRGMGLTVGSGGTPPGRMWCWSSEQQQGSGGLVIKAGATGAQG